MTDPIIVALGVITIALLAVILLIIIIAATELCYRAIDRYLW